jgi:Family of unknown function (DUF5677)
VRPVHLTRPGDDCKQVLGGVERIKLGLRDSPDFVRLVVVGGDLDHATQGRGRDLIALAAGEFPKEFDLAAGATWPMIAAALVSRMVGTLEAILDQQPKGREADAGSDVRRLLEHAVILAWLAADPSTKRIEAWQKSDVRARLAADADARAHGQPLFNDEQRIGMEAQVARLRGGRISVENAALEADGFWAGRLPGMGGKGELKSWRGFYAVVYRNYSGYTHPTMRGLNPVVVDLSPSRRRVQLEGAIRATVPTGWPP